MRRHLINYAWLLLIFFVGCGTISQEKLRDIDRRIIELSKTTQTLGKKVDDLSRSISLLVVDGNELHNEMDDMKTFRKDIQQKVEDIEEVVKELKRSTSSLKTDYEDMEDDINKTDG
ncbi:MAG: hypothetical protein E3K36_06345 [Candidatus Brocadia sp.]|nr:hypothetical protein [Candidatus Brocadia sp.]